MGTFSKKLHIKNSSGVEQTAYIYSTTSEVGSNYMYTIVDGTQGYIPLVSTSSGYATSGRVLKSGTTYAIGAGVPPSYNYSLYTASGSFTVPANVYTCRVTCVGGGAGGMTGFYPSGYLTNSTGTYTFSGVVGGTTSFGNLCSALGGQPASVTFSSGSFVSHVLSAGYNNGTGYYSDSDYHGGASAVPLVNISGTTIASHGAGGYCDENNGGRYNYTGASGYRTVTNVKVTPGSVITITIGGGGKNWGRGGYYDYAHSSKGYGAGPGSAGACLVEWGGSVV